MLGINAFLGLLIVCATTVCIGMFGRHAGFFFTTVVLDVSILCNVRYLQWTVELELTFGSCFA